MTLEIVAAALGLVAALKKNKQVRGVGNLHEVNDTLRKAEAFFDEKGISFSIYKEHGTPCGIELSTYTDLGVNMLIFLDGRDKDMTDSNWWADQLYKYYSDFDAEEEVLTLWHAFPDYQKFGLQRVLDDMTAFDEYLDDLTTQAFFYAND